LRVFAGIVSAGLFLLALAQTAALEPAREKGTLVANPPTPYIHYISSTESHRRVLVVHGLDSNKEFMQIFCAALADAGFEVYAIDLPGHGDSTSGFDGLLARVAVEHAVSYLNPDVAVGHSMGASLLIDLAHDVKFPALVLISPAPTQVNGLEFKHTLVTTEPWDLPPVNTFAPQLEGVELVKFERGMHSSALIYPGQIREIVSWLGGNPDRLHTSARLVWLGLMFAAGIALAIVLLPPRPGVSESVRTLSQKEILVSFVVAGGISVVVQRFVILFHWVRLYTMDYLVSFLFLAGLVLVISLVLRNQSITWSGPKPVIASANFAKAISAAAYVIIVLGMLAGSHLIHVTLSVGR